MGVDNLESASPDDSAELNMDAAEGQVPDTGSDPESSTGSEGEKFDLLSVVRNATAEKKEPASPAGQEESDSTDTPATPASAETATTGELDEENFSDVPFHNHPRFKELVRQRDSFRQGAEQYGQVQDFLQSNGITPEDAADQLTLLAQMKTDPAGAWEKMKPMVQQLLRDAGQVLDNDLSEQVRSGKITREAAMEISRLRAAQSSAQKASEHRQTVDQTVQQTQSLRAVQASVSEWERSARAKDPDFDAKAEDVQKELLWIHSREGVAKTPEDARKQAQRALDAVNKKTSANRGQKPAVNPLTGGRVPTGNAAANPKSMLDIVKGARTAG